MDKISDKKTSKSQNRKYLIELNWILTMTICWYHNPILYYDRISKCQMHLNDWTIIQLYQSPTLWKLHLAPSWLYIGESVREGIARKKLNPWVKSQKNFHLPNWLIISLKTVQTGMIQQSFMHILRSYTATMLSFINICSCVKEELWLQDIPTGWFLHIPPNTLFYVGYFVNNYVQAEVETPFI